MYDDDLRIHKLAIDEDLYTQIMFDKTDVIDFCNPVDCKIGDRIIFSFYDTKTFKVYELIRNIINITSISNGTQIQIKKDERYDE